MGARERLGGAWPPAERREPAEGDERIVHHEPLMHDSVMTWVDVKVMSLGLHGRILELGSLDVNGTVRSLFRASTSYLGVDKQPGPGVDAVMDANKLELEDDSFDVVVSTEMLEHDPHPWLSFQEAFRVLVPGGTLLLTTRGPGFPLHDYGGDYYRYTGDALVALAKYAGFDVCSVEDDTFSGHPGAFIHARKP
jgi:O-antigen biosynthesis protein